MKMIIAEKYYYVHRVEHRVEQILPIVMGTKRRTGGQRRGLQQSRVNEQCGEKLERIHFWANEQCSVKLRLPHSRHCIIKNLECSSAAEQDASIICTGMRQRLGPSECGQNVDALQKHRLKQQTMTFSHSGPSGINICSQLHLGSAKHDIWIHRGHTIS